MSGNTKGPTAITLVTLAVAAVPGCAPAPSVEAPYSERDSLGVTIVESVAPVWADGEGWHVDSVPRLVLAGEGPRYEFSQVPDATVLSDGRIVVADDFFDEVRFFGPDGTFLRAAGRAGEGPGDFSRIGSVAALGGDSVLVYDFMLGRGTILTDDADPVGRIVSLPPGAQVQELLVLRPDRFLGKTWSFRDFLEVAGPYRERYEVAFIDAGGMLGDPIADLAGWSGFKVNREDGGYSDFAPLFPVDGRIAAGPDAIVMGPAERMELLLYSPEGVLERIARIPSLDERLTSEEVDATREAMAGLSQAPSYQAIVRRMPAPELRPPYSDVLIDPEGFVWVARYANPRTNADDPIEWLILDPSGVWLGSITTPSRFVAFEVGLDYVLGARLDEVDVPHVQLLTLTR